VVVGFIERFKNIVKTLCLRVVGTQQIIFYSVEMIVAEVVQQQIKLLVECRLWLNVKFERFLTAENWFGCYFNNREIKCFLNKCFLIEKQLLRLHMFYWGIERSENFLCFRKRFVEFIHQGFGVLKQQYRFWVDVLKETFTVFLKKFIFDIRDDRNLLFLLDRQLGFDIECSDAVDFIPKKLNTVRIVV